MSAERKSITYESQDSLRLCALVEETGGPAKGAVVLAHGIVVDKDESDGTESGIGGFVALSQALTEQGFHVLRFDFRGHGESEGRPEEMTIAGERSDLAASMAYARERWSLPTALVGASFGAVASILYAADHHDLPCLVLWNPVLDFQATFWRPALPGGVPLFDPAHLARLDDQGSIAVGDLGYRMGRALVAEMAQMDLLAQLDRIRSPVLTLHGDADSLVPFAVARAHARCNPQSQFVPVPGGEHGFRTPEERAVVIPQTVAWIERWLR